jgi:O-antigen ligase
MEASNRSTTLPLAIGATAVAAYFFCLVWPLQGLVTFELLFSPSFGEAVRRWQMFGLVSFVGGISLLVLALRPPIHVNWPGIAFLAVVVSWLGASTLWSINPGATLQFTALTGVMFACCAAFWLLPERASRVVAGASLLAIVIAVAWLFVRLPPRLRTVGFVQANLLAHLAFAAVVLGYLADRRFRLPALVFGISLLLYSQGRTVLLGFVIFIIIYHFVLDRVRDPRSYWNMVLGLTAAATFFAILGPALITIVTEFLSTLLGVQDEERLSGSGFSGRSRIWESALNLIDGRELTGYGFRTRGNSYIFASDINAHSGVLNAMLDVGVIGVLLLAAAYLGAIFTIIAAYAGPRCDQDRVAASFLIAMGPILFVEPNYLNFAHPTSFLLMLALSNPLVCRRAAAFVALEHGRARRAGAT